MSSFVSSRSTNETLPTGFLKNLQKRPELNHHIVNILERESSKGRLAVRILSFGHGPLNGTDIFNPPFSLLSQTPSYVISVPEACVHELPGSREEGGQLVPTSDIHVTKLELLSTISRVPLPSELQRQIASYLLINKVQFAKAIAASSTDSSMGEETCNFLQIMNRKQNTWWISAPSSMPNGAGAQWVEFDLGGRRPVVSSQFTITIPPLPSGPLSVRCFHLEASSEPPGKADRAFQRASPVYSTADVSTQQYFQIYPPIESQRYVRVVCESTAGDANAVGFFHCSFK